MKSAVTRFPLPGLKTLSLCMLLLAGCGSSDTTRDAGPDADTTDASGDATVDASPGGSDAEIDADEPDAYVPTCGDHLREAPEACDDGDTTPGDGCDGDCAVEPGFSCGPSGTLCLAARCGDGIVAGLEECDDGDGDADDGCAQCRIETGWQCEAGGVCVETTCGDGTPEGVEACDDGDTDLGDGCSTLCTLEPSCEAGACVSRCGDGILDANEACDDGDVRPYDGCSPTCALEPGFVCTLAVVPPLLPMVARDFRGKDLVDGHRDFENANGNETGIVATLLGADGKPVYAKEGVPSNTTHGKALFDAWYRDALTNVAVISALPLTPTDTAGELRFDAQDFFPVDDAGWVALGMEPTRAALSGGQHNFSFTTETRFWFRYARGQTIRFRGDDDVFIFINRHLVVDLGGVHSATNGAAELTSANEAMLELVEGGVYEVAVFQAERHTSGSSYRITLANVLPARTVCASTCGDGEVDPATEQCDDGVNDGGEGECAPGCVLLP